MNTSGRSFLQVQNSKRITTYRPVKMLFLGNCITLLFLTFFFTPSIQKAFAQPGINNEINFQGKLVNSNGTNVTDGSYSVVFKLYSVTTGGTAIWTESDTVTTAAGIFQVALGATTSLPGNVNFNQANLYLGITVGSDSEMTPRIQFAAVPYAFNSSALDGVVATESATGFNLTGGTSSLTNASFTTSGSTLTFQPGVSGGLEVEANGSGNGLTLDSGTSGAVDIGTANATSLLFGNSGTTQFTFQGTGGTTLGGGLTVDGTSISVGNGSNATIGSSGTNSGLNLLSQGSGNITLGQNVGNGNIIISPNAGGQAALIVKDLGNGDIFTASSSAGTALMTLHSNGQLQLTQSGVNSGLYFAGSTSLYSNAADNLTSNATSLNFSSAAMTVASCTGCESGATTNYLQQSGNAISPYISSDDFLVGGTATNSADFAFTGDAGTTPIATFSAVANGGDKDGLSFNASTSTLQSLNNVTLSIGGSTTGNIVFNPNDAVGGLTTFNSKVGIGAAPSLATLDIRAQSGTLPIASISGKTSMAGLIVNNSGTGDLFTASSSGLTRFVIGNGGNVELAGGQVDDLDTLGASTLKIGTSNQTGLTIGRSADVTNIIGSNVASGQIAYGGGANTVAFTSGGAANNCLLNGGATPTWGSCALGTNYLQQSGNAISPYISSDDFLVGGTATNSADFAFTGDAGTTPIATFSAVANGGDKDGLSFNASTSTLQSLNNVTLSIGGSTTGNIVFNPNDAVGGLTTFNSKVGIGAAPSLATLDIRAQSGTLPIASISGKTSMAGLIVNNSGTGDLFTASSSGLTRFVVAQNGNVFLGGSIISASASGSTNNGSPAEVNALPDQGSLVPNAGFEADATHSLIGDGWVPAASEAALLTLDTTPLDAAQGNNSLKYTPSAVNQQEAFYSACIPLTGGDAYDLDYSVKSTTAAGGTVRAYIDTYSNQASCVANNSPAVLGPVNTATAGVTAGWAVVTSTAAESPAAGQTWGRVHFLIGTTANSANDDTWVDAVRLWESTLNSGLDYAEDYPADPNDIPQPGDVVSLEASGSSSLVIPSDNASDQNEIGVVSTNPGEVLTGGTVNGPVVPIALAGRVPVNASTIDGPIAVGDYLTTSLIPGVAVKATGPGPVIGTAMQADTDLNLTDTTQITMFVKNTYYPGPVGLSDGVNLPGIPGDVGDISMLSGDTPVSSISSVLESLAISGSATVSGNLRVEGDSLIEGILNVVDTVTTNNIIVNTLADFFGDVTFHSGVTFQNSPVFTSDTGGFAVINAGSSSVTVRFKGTYSQTPVVSASVISNPLTPTPGAPASGKGNTQNAGFARVSYLITNQTTHGFTILLNKPSKTDVAFSWLALAVDSPVIFESDSGSQTNSVPFQSSLPSPIDANTPTGIPSSSISPSQMPVSQPESTGPE